MVEAIQEALAAAQRAMSTGDAPGARGHYEKALGLADTEERKGEIHLSLAEMTWQAGDKAVALEHYASARRLATMVPATAVAMVAEKNQPSGSAILPATPVQT